MPASIRQQIVDAIRTRFLTIMVVNGYAHTLTGKVHRWRDTLKNPFADNELPGLNYRDLREFSTDVLMPRVQEHRLIIEVDLITKTSVVDDDVRSLLADVLKAIGTDAKWSSLAQRTEPNPETGPSNQFDVQQDGRNVAACRIHFAIIYRTKAFDPYTQ